MLSTHYIAEVVLFTAGLEDYAAPICNAIESRYGAFAAKLFRPATVASDAYPCVKVSSMKGSMISLQESFSNSSIFLRCCNRGADLCKSLY